MSSIVDKRFDSFIVIFAGLCVVAGILAMCIGLVMSTTADQEVCEAAGGELVKGARGWVCINQTVVARPPTNCGRTYHE